MGVAGTTLIPGPSGAIRPPLVIGILRPPEESIPGLGLEFTAGLKSEESCRWDSEGEGRGDVWDVSGVGM